VTRRSALVAVVAATFVAAAPAAAAPGPVDAAGVRPTTVYVGAPLPVLRFHTNRAATLTLSLVHCGKLCPRGVTVAVLKETFNAGTHTLGIATLLRLGRLTPRVPRLRPAIYAVVFKQGSTVLGSTDFGINGKI
jgi:hypothetical protein